MESLALLAGLIMLSFWTIAILALLFTFIGLRLLGSVFGALSCAVGIWLLCILPHAPFLGTINILIGIIAIRRYFINN